MFSGTCKKRETGQHHARMIQTILDAATKVNVQKNTTYHTVCITSDSEAKHGDALVILMMISLPIIHKLTAH